MAKESLLLRRSFNYLDIKNHFKSFISKYFYIDIITQTYVSPKELNQFLKMVNSV